MVENMELKEVTSGNQTKENLEKPKGKIMACLRTNLLTILTVSGVILGAILGFILRETAESEWTNRQIMYVNFLGDIFLRALKSLILPLIMSSLVSAIASLDLSLSGKIAARAISYYMITTVLAVILGIILVITIQPGKNSGGHQPTGNSTMREVTTVDTLLDLIRNMLPPNLIQACTQQYRTVLKPNNRTTNIYDWDIEDEYTDGTNILGLVIFSSVLGIALAMLGKEGKALTDVFQALAVAMMKITTWVIWTSPLGVLFLVASKILEMKDIETVMAQLGLYFTTVLVGIIIHGFIVLPIIFFVMTKKSPFQFITKMGQAMATAFGTSSSSATLPVTLKCLEDNLGIDKRVTRFAIPIGATINMDGTALYEAVAAIFIAQVRNVQLSIGNLIAISITATAASIGAAGIPQAGLVTMVMVLDTVGLPAEDVTLIIAVDWLLDRFRTLINVLGDSFGAGIVDHRSKAELNKMPDAHFTLENNN